MVGEDVGGGNENGNGNGGEWAELTEQPSFEEAMAERGDAESESEAGAGSEADGGEDEIGADAGFENEDDAGAGEDVVKSAAEVENAEEILPKALANMRDNWGNLENTKGIFGPKTEMAQYEYGVIGENMTFEEFAAFGDAAYELGHKSEAEYHKMLYDKGSELQTKGLCLWTSFAIAVRRYNVAKHLPEFGENPKFYCAMSLDMASSALSSGRLEGWKMRRETGGDLEVVHLTTGMDDERAKPVVMALDETVTEDDTFDLATKAPSVREVKFDAEHQMMVARNLKAFDYLRREKKMSGYLAGAEIPIMTQKEWMKAQGIEDGGPEEDYRKYGQELLRKAITKVDKAEVREFVSGALEKVETGELERLVAGLKDDYEAGAKEAIRYFAEVIGMRPLMLRIESQKGDTLGRHSAVGGAVILNERGLKRDPIQTLNVIAHEMWHGYQHELERQYSRGELEEGSKEAEHAELYSFCQEHYEITLGSDRLYRKQILEAEAFAFGDGVEKILRQERWRERWAKIKGWFKRGETKDVIEQGKGEL